MIEHIEKIDSTNALALREFAKFADGTLLTAGEQTAGIGRRGRSWLSPPDVNLYATYIIKAPAFPPSDAMLIGGLATLTTLRRFSPEMELWLKWPNDICCGPLARNGGKTNHPSTLPNFQQEIPNNEHRTIQNKNLGGESRGFKKIAGLLAQTHSPDASNEVDGVVIGIGVNLNMTPEQLSAIDRPAASLFSETGEFIDLSTFADFLLKELVRYRKLAESDPESLSDKWIGENALIGERVEMSLEDSTSFSGRVAAIRRNGAVVIESESGVSQAFIAGDVLPPED
ncbi:MAG: biotin--[acetyl-CoA-carboxylase] ligase [Victivallales bacterium]|nr:biotin--[acetyl-CoA-carboxylase] ligase [Victivallales bacterium]